MYWPSYSLKCSKSSICDVVPAIWKPSDSRRLRWKWLPPSSWCKFSVVYYPHFSVVRLFIFNFASNLALLSLNAQLLCHPASRYNNFHSNFMCVRVCVCVCVCKFKCSIRVWCDHEHSKQTFSFVFAIYEWIRVLIFPSHFEKRSIYLEFLISWSTWLLHEAVRSGWHSVIIWAVLVALSLNCIAPWTAPPISSQFVDINFIGYPPGITESAEYCLGVMSVCDMPRPRPFVCLHLGPSAVGYFESGCRPS